MSSPIGCCTPAARARPCSSAPTPSARWCARWCPTAEIEARPRFSALSYRRPAEALEAAAAHGGRRVLRRRGLRDRRAAPARQRGGTAVVLGALSPRTRNAQVRMYQAGEVDYLVATDAIGMGLNMDVDHVAFAALAQVRRRALGARSRRRARADRRPRRPLHEGRHLRHHRRGRRARPGRGGGDRAPPLRPAGRAGLAQRRPRLPLASTPCCAASSGPPPAPGLLRAREADDHAALRYAGARSGTAAAPARARRCACCGRSARSRTSARP